MSPTAVAVAMAVLLAQLAWPAAAGELFRSPPNSCASRLLKMSACEVAVSAPRIICAPSPSSDCCRAFSSVMYDDRSSGGAECLCKLVGSEGLISFPVNASRLLCLFPMCSASEEAALTAAASFLRACGGSDVEEDKKPHIPGDEEEKRQQLLIYFWFCTRVLQIVCSCCWVLLTWTIVMWTDAHLDRRRLMLHID